MSASSEEDKRAHLTPEQEVLRELEGLEGEVEVEILYGPALITDGLARCSNSEGRLVCGVRSMERRSYSAASCLWS
jgi:hypothetical protein